MENLDEEVVLDCVRELRSCGRDSIAVIYALSQGMLGVGRRFEKAEYYLADLIVSGSIYRQALKLLEIGVEDRKSGSRPNTVLIGVVKNDIHDIGKDIVVGTLSAGGFKVIDLGSDVDMKEFLAAVRQHKPRILALGGTMGFAADEMERIITALADEKLRDGLQIIVGGVAVSRSNVGRIGADFYAPDPIEMLNICKQISDE
jgi:methanogenic corrinoid protein MtbC1